MRMPKKSHLPRWKERHWTDKRGGKHSAYYYELAAAADGRRPLKSLGTDRIAALREYAAFEAKLENEVGLKADDFSVRATYRRYMAWAEVPANSGLSRRTIKDRK